MSAARREPAGAAGVGTSLLFTPVTKAADGQKGTPADFRSFSGLGRTPASAGRQFGGAGLSPPSRRRSVTPTSTRQADTPPPPPRDSLLDSPGGLPAVPADAAQEAQAGPSAFAPALQTAAGAAAAAGPEAPGSPDATWVTVFGFSQSELPVVIREFSKAGDIKQFGTFGEPATANWVHIQYQNKHAMRRALLRNGERISATCMVGVTLPSRQQRAAMESGGGTGTAGGAGTMAYPAPQQQRPYTLTSAANGLPLATRTLPQRMREFVLGL